MENLRPILSGVLGSLVTAALLAWAMRAPPASERPGLIYYNRRLRILAVVMLAIGSFIGYAALHASASQRALAYSIGGGCFLFGVWFVLETLFVGARLSPTHLLVWSPWRARRNIPWSAIKAYEYSRTMMWHVLTTEGFGKVRFSCYLSGVEQLTEHLPAGMLDADPEG